MSPVTPTIDEVWTDDEDRPYGGWVPIEVDEYLAIIAGAGGLAVLSVFSTLTDPDGCYGRPQVYTAWGRDDDPHPLVDVRDYKEDGETVEQIRRKFVLVPSQENGGAR